MPNLKNNFYQNIRLIDVFILAPAMFIVADKSNASEPLKRFVKISAIATALFNGINYLEIKQDN